MVIILASGVLAGMFAPPASAENAGSAYLAPFEYEKSAFQPIALEAAEMLEIKLRKGGLKVISDETKKDTAVWFLHGRIEDAGIDDEKPMEGPWFIGYRRIPVFAAISITLKGRDAGAEPLVFRERGETRIPRFCFMGKFRNPLPSEPRTIDAVIHKAVVSLARKILDVTVNENATR